MERSDDQKDLATRVRGNMDTPVEVTILAIKVWKAEIAGYREGKQHDGNWRILDALPQCM